MAMNRREFIKQSAAVSAAVAITPLALALPEIKVHPLDMPRPRTTNVYDLGDSRLAIFAIQRTYSMAWHGSDSPTLMLFTPVGFAEFKNKVNPKHLIPNPARGFTCFRFNDADVAVGRNVPPGEAWFINEKHPEVSQYNAILKFYGVAHAG